MKETGQRTGKLVVTGESETVKSVFIIISVKVQDKDSINLNDGGVGEFE